ncbi:hypothetical protein D020_0061A, partial [Vibrio parahaemolyticus SBR10290]
MPKQCRSEIQY